MSKREVDRFDEFLNETVRTRYNYLDTLIEKYVNTKEKGVEINIQTLTVIKSKSYLKTAKEKPFGSVTTYNCSAARKIAKYWQKEIKLEEMVFIQRNDSPESFYDLRSGKCKRKGKQNSKKKHLSPSKVSNTFLSNRDEESEMDLSNETLNNDQDSILFSGKNETTLSNKDNITLLVNGKKQTLSISDLKKLSNSDIKVCDIIKYTKLEIFEKFSFEVCNRFKPTDPKHKFDNIISCANNICSYNVSSTKRDIDQYFQSKSKPKFKLSEMGKPKAISPTRDIDCYFQSKSKPKFILSKMGKPNDISQMSGDFSANDITSSVVVNSAERNDGYNFSSKSTLKMKFFEMNKSNKVSEMYGDFRESDIISSVIKKAKRNVNYNFTSKSTATMEISNKNSQMSMNFGANNSSACNAKNIKHDVGYNLRSRSTSSIEFSEMKKSNHNPQMSRNLSASNTSSCIINNTKRNMPYNLRNTSCNAKNTTHNVGYNLQNKSISSIEFAPKIKISEMVKSNENHQMFRESRVKLVRYIPKESVETPNHRIRKCQTNAAIQNCHGLLSIPFSSSCYPSLGNKARIDDLSLRAITDKPDNEKASKGRLSLRKSESYISYLEKNCTIDDLSLRSFTQTPKNQEKRINK